MTYTRTNQTLPEDRAVLEPSAMAREVREGRIGLRMSAEEMAELDEVRRAEPDMPQRSEMLRRLIRRAAAELKAEAKPPKKKPGD